MTSARTFCTRGRDPLARRVASATVGIPLVLVLIQMGAVSFLLLVTVAVLIGSWEFYRLTRIPQGWRVAGAALGVVCVVLGWAALAAPLGLLVLTAPFVLFFSFRIRPGNWRRLLLTLAAPLYIGASLSHSVLIWTGSQGVLWVYATLFATFAVDTGAYFVGRRLGRHRMAPGISPGKTWEGAAGGFLAGIAATVAFAHLTGLHIDPTQSLLLGVAFGITAQAGDLVESAVKRASNAKEAGSIIPGHGGLLDRLDSLMFNLVVVYYFTSWVAS